MNFNPPVRDTIFALSSGQLPAPIAVVRITGPRASEALQLVGRIPAPRRAVLARIKDPVNNETIDAGLLLWLPGPNSETGEDVVELQLHGGRAVVSAVLAVLGRLDGFRLAEPGEFTRRAFENGRLDLTEVEGLADLIYAETETQRRQAYRQLGGMLGERAEFWRAKLIEALALVEARIDFSDEGDVPQDLVAPALALAKSLRDEMISALADGRRGERVREGFVVAIAGPPNAGKSSLLNRIVGREAAIVTSMPGTTRDIIEVHLDLNGYAITLLDTAGVRDSDDPVEQEGIRRARARAGSADLVLWICDASREETGPDESRSATGPPVWHVHNKVDLVDAACLADRRAPVGKAVAVSALTGQGIDDLLRELTEFVGAMLRVGEPALVTRERHRIALQEAVVALDRVSGYAGSPEEEFIAEDLRLAARALGKLTGRVDVEDVLDVIFRDFCIGK